MNNQRFLNKAYSIIKEPEISNDIDIKDKNVNLSFLMTQKRRNGFYIIYIINLFTNDLPLDGKIRSSDIDLRKLKRIILNKIGTRDSKYLKINTLTPSKVEFEFNIDRWMLDATRGIRPVIHFSTFDRQFKLKEKLPKVIMFNNPSLDLNEFVVSKFKDYLDKHKSKTKSYFKFLFPNLSRKMKDRIKNMFDWQYDNIENNVIARLKPIYVMALVYAAGELTKKETKLSDNKRKYFETKVKKNITKVNRQKFDDYVKTKIKK
jgi:hypothetical protein